jgi:hypothetical protein
MCHIGRLLRSWLRPVLFLLPWSWFKSVLLLLTGSWIRGDLRLPGSWLRPVLLLLLPPGSFETHPSWLTSTLNQVPPGAAGYCPWSGRGVTINDHVSAAVSIMSTHRLRGREPGACGYVYVCEHVCVCLRIRGPCMCVCMCVSESQGPVCMCIFTYIHVCVYICVPEIQGPLCVCVYMYMYV